MNGYFDVTGTRIGQLDSNEAVIFVHDLLHAEASVVGGVDHSKISVPSTPTAITSSDGGVDAEVLEASPGAASHGVIKSGRTSYQIKTGAFNLSTLAKARKIIKVDYKKEFKPRVKSCFEAGGTLVVILFGSDNPETSDQLSINNLRDAIREIDVAYENANIEVWHQNTIVGFLKHFPSLRLKLQQQPANNLHSIDTWARLDDMRRDMVIGEDQQALIKGIRESVVSTQTEPLRLLGDPGVGKTRTALEALSEVEHRSTVIYAENPSALPDGFLNRFLQNDNDEHAILVVDECEPSQRSGIWNKVKEVADRVKLITIYNIEEAPLPDMVQLDAKPLTSEQVEEIFTSDQYNIPQDDARRLAALCSGSPRVAHIVAQDVTQTGDVNINSREDVWKRYVAGTDSIDGEPYRKRLAVLKWIALFRRFGYDRPKNAEGDLMAKKITQEESISDGEFRTIIKDLRARKILQGDTTLYITPKLLHIWLWASWWGEHEGSFDYDTFIKIDGSTQFNEQLIDWFFDMLRYGKTTTVVPKIVEDLLQSPLGNPDFLDSERGSKLVQILAGVDQEAVLNFIEQHVNASSIEELQEFRKGRRGFVNALELIAVAPQHFVRSANALLRLAEAENETWSNNASGTFAGLFTNSYGKVAPSAASPEQRFPVLEQAIKSATPEAQKVIVSAINQGLEAWHFMRMSGDDGSGLLDKVERWTPKTYKELWDAYRRIWKLAFDNLSTFTEQNRQVLIGHMITQLRGMITRLGIQKDVISWINDLIASELIDNRGVLKEVVTILHYDKKDLPAETVKELTAIKNHLTGSGYEALVRRYVGVSMLEDEFDDNGERSDHVTKEIEALAKESIEDNAKFDAILPWLVTKEPDNSYTFGAHIGSLDTNNKFLESIINAQKKVDEVNASTQFLAGYLMAVHRRDEILWEVTLDALAKDRELQKLVPEITWRSGMTDHAMRRIIDLSRKKIVDDSVFRMFGYGSSLEPLTNDAFEELVEYLLTSEYESVDSIVLDYAAFFYEMKKKAVIPEGLGFRILTQPSLLVGRETPKRNQMDDFYWSKVAEEYIAVYPQRALDLANVIVDHFGENDTIVDGYRDAGGKILTKIASLNPQGVWSLVSPRISKLKKGGDLQLMWWLTGGIAFGSDRDEGAISLFPPDLLWSWIDENAKERAEIIANYIPKRLFKEEGKVCLARELLVRYGDSADVRRAFSINNGNEGWSGNASVHYTNKLNYLLEFEKSEDNKNVLQWINEYVIGLKKQIEHSRIEEERDDW